MVRRAHAALAVAFIAFGTVDGTWAARLPALERRLDLDSGSLGITIFCVSLTATLMLVPAGVLASHRGSAVLGRPVLSALRGAWSSGLLIGSGVAAVMAAMAIGPRVQFPATEAGVLVSGSSPSSRRVRRMRRPTPHTSRGCAARSRCRRCSPSCSMSIETPR